MEHQSPKAILVVSFGTSYEASRKATIEKIEQDIADAFPDYRILSSMDQQIYHLCSEKKRRYFHSYCV